ncbi:MAG: WecB/TagA/CpsF family glycosyltransferase [Patescibacteria group bacterium]
MKINILDVWVDVISLDGVLQKINQWLADNGQYYIVTPNPEFVVAAQKNKEFKDALNGAGLAISDGVGLIWASGGKLKRVTGVELVEELFKIKNQNYKFYLLGGEEGIAAAVKQKYQEANIVGAQSGGRLNTEDWLLENNETVINSVNNSGANIILVAFGQVKQEMWMVNNLAKLSNIKVAIGVGGTFDYLSGKIKRAPVWLRRLGFEWLFRLIVQPKRINRIFKAIIVFNWLLIKKWLNG